MKNLKISQTAYRVLLFLYYLNIGDYNTKELNSFFAEDPFVERYFSKDVLLKYLNTIKIAGFEISKPITSNEYKYSLDKAPSMPDFSDELIKQLAKLQVYVESTYQDKLIADYAEFFKKIQKYLTEDQIILFENELYEQYDEMGAFLDKYKSFATFIKKIEKYKNDNQQIKVVQRSPFGVESSIIIELHGIKYETNDISLIGYNPAKAELKTIKYSNIIEITQLPTVSQGTPLQNKIIFKLKGKLAKVYRPYKDENVIACDDTRNEITINAKTKNMEVHLKRLLKYGEACEVLYPKKARTMIKGMVEATLKKYCDKETQVHN